VAIGISSSIAKSPNDAIKKSQMEPARARHFLEASEGCILDLRKIVDTQREFGGITTPSLREELPDMLRARPIDM